MDVSVDSICGSIRTAAFHFFLINFYVFFFNRPALIAHPPDGYLVPTRLKKIHRSLLDWQR